MNRLLSILLLGLPAPLFAQTDTDSDREGKPVRQSSVATANNAFGWDLYRVLSKRPGNVFFSPYSVSAALAMTRLGAGGRTADQMDRVLHTTDLKIASGFRALAGKLVGRKVREYTDASGENMRSVPSYDLRIAQALWGQTGFDFEQPFLDVLSEQFGAPLRRVDFAEPDRVRDLINTWVEKHTVNKIRKIVPPGLPTRGTRLVLGNAIYFKAPWAEKFWERGTRPQTFTMSGGKVMTTPMMRLQRQFRYASTDDAQVLQISFRGHDTSMVVVLPKNKDGLAAIEAKLSPDLVESWRGALHSQLVSVNLPRFEFTSSIDLTEILPKMGMSDAFSADRADFSAMTKADRLCIGAVLHKAFIGVDEKGAEAAAATIVMMKVGSAMPRNKPVPFVADHPFLFFIQHNKTKCVLFSGRVMAPSVSSEPVKTKSAKRRPAKSEKKAKKLK